MQAFVSSCPKCREQWEGGRRRDWGGGDASGFPEKEPSADCHLCMTKSAPPHFPFFPLFLQLWVLKSVLYAQMLGFALRLLAALWGRSAPGCPTCGHAPGPNKGWGGRLWEGKVREPHAESRNPEEDSRDRLASINPLESCLRSALTSSNWVGSSDWKGSPVSYTQAPGGSGGHLR